MGILDFFKSESKPKTLKEAQRRGVISRTIIIRKEDLKSRAIPADMYANVERHGCVVQPEYFYSLAEFPDYNSYHQRCLSVKATCVAGLGYHLNNEKAKKVAAFLDAPNLHFEETFDDMIVRFWYDYKLYGNAAFEVKRVGQEMKALYHLPFRDLYVQDDRSAYWQLTPEGSEQQFVPYGQTESGLSEVVHIKDYTPKSSYYGLPRYLGAMTTMAVNKVVLDYNLNFFSNSAIPDMALIIEGGKLDTDSEEELVNYLTDNFKGVDNAHKLMYVPVTDPHVKIRFEKLNSSNMHGFFRFLRADNRDEVISVHGVPPRLVGVLTSGQLGSGNEARGQLQTFLQIDVRPEQRKLEMFLNRFFEREFGVNPDIRFTQLDLTHALEDAQIHQIYQGIGAMEIDEIREDINLVPLAEVAVQKSLHRQAQGEFLQVLRGFRRSLQETINV